MEGEMRVNKNLLLMGMLSLTMAAAVVLVSPAPADASIHEIIGALCREGGEEVVPPGQNRDGRSFVRALQATGVIESIERTATAVIIRFDTDLAPSKYISAGRDLVIEDAIAPGVDLILMPLIVPNPDFPAHANCRNLNP
jgi:hypothetical protein